MINNSCRKQGVAESRHLGCYEDRGVFIGIGEFLKETDGAAARRRLDTFTLSLTAEIIGRQAPLVNRPVITGLVFHELMHAYHDLLAPDGFGNECIRSTYDIAVHSQALHYGLERRHLPNTSDYGDLESPWKTEFVANSYATKNDHEYFAELASIYYLGQLRYSSDGDTYPRDRWDLAEYDRNGFEMIARLIDGDGCGDWTPQ